MKELRADIVQQACQTQNINFHPSPQSFDTLCLALRFVFGYVLLVQEVLQLNYYLESERFEDVTLAESEIKYLN